MRLTATLLAAGLFAMLAMPGHAQDDPQPIITSTPNANLQNIVVTPDAWKDLGVSKYGRNYQVYIPKETKSDNPEAMRTWNPAGYPRNGRQQTPEGNTCATDADCKVPLGCFARADSGALPVRVCAFPPAY